MLFPLLISLGLWQLDREQQKIAMQLRYEQRQAQAPVPLEQINWRDEELGWMRISATGYYEPRRQFLLDNRIHETRVGYEVLTPFATDYGLLLINRGWINQGATRQILPPLPVSTERVTVSALIYVPDGELMMLATDDLSGPDWPKVVQRIDLEKFSAAFGDQFLPYSARLESGAEGLLQYNWQPINTRSETHRGYALQWFLMSLVLIILYFMFSFRRSE
jgi:surfeit locus 1 family protein